MKSNFRIQVVLPLVLVFAVLVALAPRTAKWNFEYHKGHVWTHETLKADFDFPILKTDEQIEREQASLSKSVTYYRFSQEITNTNLRKLEQTEIEPYSEIKAYVVSTARKIYEKGIVPDSGVETGKNSESADPVIYIQKDKRAVKVPSTEVYLLSDARSQLLYTVSSVYPTVPVDSVLRAASVYDLILPNLVYDEQLSNLISSQNVATVSPTLGYVNTGDLIVSHGEMVTAEIAQMLDSYKKEYETNVGYSGSPLLMWLKNMLMALVIVVCLYFAIHFSNPLVFKDTNRYYYILTVFVIMSLAEILIIRFWPRWIYLFPFSVGALYLQAFFRTRVIYPVYIVSLIPFLLFADKGVEYFMMYLAAGTVTLYVFKHFSRGVKQFITALITFGVTSVVYLAFNLLDVSHLSLRVFLMLFAGSMLQVAAYPFIFLMERVFNLVSSSRLRELGESSNPLLRSLEQKAPGTFQHSLQLKNIASAAARAIGANVPLIEAGAMYHDIGKTNNPQCFVENESLTTTSAKYHTQLSPIQSAQDIIRHVSDGVEMAKDAKLPPVIIDFILSHHGTGFVSFFYDKHIKEGGDPALRPEFCYPGRKPQTKEQVILMLADSVEAASRTLMNYTPETVSNLVDKLVQNKIDEDQLSESDITEKELGTVKEVMKSFILQLHHDRIKYPERKKTNNQIKK